MDRKELEAWLNARPRADAVLIAQRAALRAWPVWGAAMRQSWARKREITSLPVLRSLLTSGVARKYPTPEVKRAAAASTTASSAFASDTSAARTSAAAATSAASIASATSIASAAAAFATASTTTTAAEAFADAIVPTFWRQVEQDVAILTAEGDLLATRLWHDSPPAALESMDAEALDALTQETGDPKSFWHRWYLSARDGKWMDWDMQRDIALIPDEVWKHGHKAVAEAIAEIEARYSTDPLGLDSELRELPPAPTSQIGAVKAAMERNRQCLPPTFDAIEGLLLLEIERLQNSNDRDEAWERQMRIYLTLHEAVRRLRHNLPALGPISDEQAQTSEKLVRLYMREYSELPRAKVDEIVEGTWNVGKGVIKAGLIGTTALLGMAYGLPAYAGVAIGAMVFARKDAGEIIKLAKEALPKQGA